MHHHFKKYSGTQHTFRKKFLPSREKTRLAINNYFKVKISTVKKLNQFNFWQKVLKVKNFNRECYRVYIRQELDQRRHAWWQALNTSRINSKTVAETCNDEMIHLCLQPKTLKSMLWDYVSTPLIVTHIHAVGSTHICHL